MRFGKIIIGFLTVLLMVLLLFAGTQETRVDDMEVALSFSVQSGQGMEVIQCWKNEEGEFYVFLPGYAELDQVSAILGNAQAAIGGVTVSGDMSCREFELDWPYPFTYEENGRSLQSTITFLRSGNLPSLYIDVQSGSMDYIHMDKNNKETGVLRLYGVQGEEMYSGKLDVLKGRGNTSWSAEKKPYNLTLSQEADLLGLGAAQHWILLAEGYNALNIRNKIVFDFADRAGLAYSPDCEWVDLYLNGEYAGVYLLTERNEIHRERVDISEEGSFLISMENKKNMDLQKLSYVALDSTQVLRLRSTSLNNQELTQIWAQLKNALLSEDGRDPETGKHWLDMIDLDSWVRKYLIEEIFANPDGGAVSQYFYMDGADPERRICAGPVWDYDYSMGGEDFWMKNYPSFLVMAREYTDDGMYLPWFYELYRKEAFYSRLQEIYAEEYLPLFMELTQTGLENYFEKIAQAAASDQVRWENTGVSLEGEVAFIRSFLENRLTFLSDLWINGTEYHTVRVNPGQYEIDGYFAVKNGDTLPKLPDYELLGGIGWYDADTGETFDITQPIHEDAYIYVKKTETSLPVIHYVPVAAVMVVLLLLFLCDRVQTKKNGRQRNDSAQVK